MSLRFAARLAERRLDADLALGDGETLALLGLNGSGKSTVLSILAGLLRPDSGKAVLDGREIFRVGQDGNGDFWPTPRDRNVVLLAQEPLLFPHLTVVENVAFGPRSRGASRTRARQVARNWLDEVGLDELAQRRPIELSGGQAQRAALARALAADPQLLLLDEPLAALDVQVAAEVRQVLRRVLVGRDAIMVTHDVLDTVLLADRVTVLEAGRVAESGPTGQVMRQPRSAFAASIAGLNLCSGTALDQHSLRDETGAVIVGEAAEPVRAGESVFAVFRPAAVSVHLDRPTGSPRNSFAAPITALEPQAHLIRVRAGDLCADITPAAVADLRLAVGTPVTLAVKAAEVAIYPAASQSGRQEPSRVRRSEA